MKKIIILMLIILGFTSCVKKNASRQDSEVFSIENVTVSPTTMTFKFRGVDKPRTYSLIACQDEEGKYPSYKAGEIVKISENRVYHVELFSETAYYICWVIALIFGGLIGFGIAHDIYS